MIHRGLGIIASNRIRVNVEHLRMQNILVARQGTIGQAIFQSNQGSTHRVRVATGTVPTVKISKSRAAPYQEGAKEKISPSGAWIPASRNFPELGISLKFHIR